MIELLLIRHGEAGAAARDESRRLTAQGRVDLAAQRRRLEQRDLLPDVFHVSPLVRTRETAEILAGAIEVIHDEALAPSGDAVAYVEALVGDSGPASIAVVGHQPTMSFLTARLIGGGSIAFPPGTIAVLDVGRSGGHLRALLPP